MTNKEIFYKRDIWNWHVFLRCHNCGETLDQTVSKHHGPVVFCTLKCLMEWQRAYSTLMPPRISHDTEKR